MIHQVFVIFSISISVADNIMEMDPDHLRDNDNISITPSCVSNHWSVRHIKTRIKKNDLIEFYIGLVTENYTT